MTFHLIDEAINMLRIGIGITKEITEPREKATNLRLLAGMFDDLGLKDEARELLLDAAKAALRIPDVDDRIMEIRVISSELRYSGFLEDSLKILEDALKSVEDAYIEEKLYAFTQVISELLEAKALDFARELVYRIIDLFPRIESVKIEDPDLLLDTFKLVAIFEKGDVLKDLFSIIILKLDDIEDSETRDDIYLDLAGIIIRLGWIDELREIILNKISHPETKIEGIIKFVEFVVSQIEKLKDYSLEFEED